MDFAYAVGSAGVATGALVRSNALLERGAHVRAATRHQCAVGRWVRLTWGVLLLG